MKLKDFTEKIGDVLFTRRCKLCGNVCDIRNVLCDECIQSSPRIENDICYKCGCEKPNCTCSSLRFVFFESICAPFYYEGTVQKGVSRFKYNDRHELAKGFSKEMADCVRNRYKGYDFDLCTFMPCHPTTLKSRGYNQAELLALGVAEELGVPCKELIKKDYITNEQHNLPLYRRSGNLSGALSYSRDESTDITGMRILLCDDIKTSGRSLDECAKILLFNGAAEVRCVTLCVAKRHPL